MKHPLGWALSVLLGALLASSFARAENSQSYNLSLDRVQKGVTPQGDRQIRFDLIAELRRQNPPLANLESLDVSRVEISLKAGVGGAASYLVVNNEYVDSQSIETDPDQLNNSGGDAVVSLKNSERRVETAQLVLVGIVQLRSVVVVLGEIEDVVVLGQYANADANKVGQAGGSEPAPPTPPAPTTPVTPTEPPAPTNPQPAPSRPGCVQNFCIGDVVLNNFDFEGKIVGVDQARGVLKVKFSFSAQPVDRPPRLLRHKK